MARVYKYQFREGLDLRDVEDTMLLTFLAAEGLFGEARVRMDGAHEADRENRALTVDAATAVGQFINMVFTVYAIREFGRDAFTVHRLAQEVMP